VDKQFSVDNCPSLFIKYSIFICLIKRPKKYRKNQFFSFVRFLGLAAFSPFLFCPALTAIHAANKKPAFGR
jgi:hypothetical protein